MTICIAAIAERNKIVAVTDKMTTLVAPVPTTFEMNDGNKVIPLDDKICALFAGDVIHGNEILNLALSYVSQNKGQNPMSVLQVAENVNQAFRDHWEARIANYLEMKFKLDLKTFMHNHPKFDPDFVRNTTRLISKFKIEVEIIIAGIDKEAHLYVVNSAGTVVSLDPISYACIGSGARHATLSLIESDYSSRFKMADSLYALLQAKKRAEYDPGVGELCDIALIDKKFEKLPDRKVSKIISSYESSSKEMISAREKCSKKIKKDLGQ